MNTVIYARYSSDKQSENTIEAQIRYCTEYCEKHNYNIVNHYIDRATSASSHIEKRIQFQQMIKDSEKHLFDSIIVFKLDRFARNRYDSATYKNKLKKNNVSVISATENITGDKESIILESVLEGMAEYFSKDLSEKVSSGMREAVRKGQTLGGVTPLGYSIVDKKMVLNEQAPIVKEAFERYINGESMYKIINDFNIRGFRSSKGKLFNKNSFHSIFTNEKYIGVLKFQDLRIENAIPAVVDIDTFNKAQARFLRNKKGFSPNKAKASYLLSYKLICGKCGSYMAGESGTAKNGERYYYYKCSNRKNKKNCDMLIINRDVVEKTVLSATINILTPKIINYIADTILNIIKEDRQKTIIPAIEAELNKVNTKIDNLLVALSQYQSTSIVDKLKELEKQKKSLTQSLEIEEKQEPTIDKDKILFFFDKVLEQDKEALEYGKSLIDCLVEKVIVHETENKNKPKLEIIFDLSLNNTIMNNEVFELGTQWYTLGGSNPRPID